MNPYATGISHDNPLRIDALYGCPHVLPKEHTFNFITPRYLRIEKKTLMEPLYLRGHYLSSDEERKTSKKRRPQLVGAAPFVNEMYILLIPGTALSFFIKQ